MTKKELVFCAAERANMDKEVVEKVLNSLLNESKKAVINGMSIFIRGFGTLEPAIRKEKIGQDIRKGKSVIIPEHTVPRFRASQAFKDEVTSGMVMPANQFPSL